MKDKYYMFKSDRPLKRYIMLMPSHNHIHYFGSSNHRNYTLMNDPKSKYYEQDHNTRERVKYNYHKRHLKEKGGVHTASSMSKMILWNKKNLTESIKSYEKKFNVSVHYSNKKLTDKKKKELMG